MNQAIAVLAFTASAVAIQAGEENRIDQCRTYMTTYNAQSSNAAERRRYAECVNLTEADERPTPEWMNIGLRLAVLSILLGAIVGCIRAYRNEERSYFEIGLSGFFSAMSVFAAECVVGSLLAAVLFVFGAI